MELGSGAISWFYYVPEYNGNRDLPPEEQLSLEVRRMSTLEVLAITEAPGRLHAWRDEILRTHFRNEPEVSEKVRLFSDAVLARYQQFVQNTRSFSNFKIDGREETDPVRLFVLIPRLLVSDINNTITAASHLHGEDLGNFVSQCGGYRKATSPARSEAGSGSGAGPAPSATDDLTGTPDHHAACIPQGTTA